MLPVWWETVKVSLKDAYKIRRVYRRLAKMRGRGIYAISRCLYGTRTLSGCWNSSGTVKRSS
jgi:hypothetical protein